MAKFTIDIDVEGGAELASLILQRAAEDIAVHLDAEGLAYSVQLADPVSGSQEWETLDLDAEILDDLDYLG